MSDEKSGRDPGDATPVVALFVDPKGQSGAPMNCIKCGKEAGELSPEMRRAKERMGMPLTPPKVCPACLWSALTSDQFTSATTKEKP